MSLTTRRFFFAALAACAILLGFAAPASAISISIDSIAKLPADTANGNTTATNRGSEWNSQVSTLNAGGAALDVVSNSVVGQTRYASTLGADSNGAAFASQSRDVTSAYRVFFTVNSPNPNVIYDITIGTGRFGALVNRDEGGANGEERIDAVAGFLNGVGQGGLNLAGLPQQSTNSTVVTPINQTNSLLVTNVTGNVTWFVDFVWTSRVSSGNNVLSGGDEAVVLLGLNTQSLGLIGAADDYPGTSGRTAANDGHFVTVNAAITQIVPEPSTFLLAGMAGLGMGLVVWRRRKL